MPPAWMEKTAEDNRARCDEGLTMHTEQRLTMLHSAPPDVLARVAQILSWANHEAPQPTAAC